jgi:hypothetical protein
MRKIISILIIAILAISAIGNASADPIASDSHTSHWGSNYNLKFHVGQEVIITPDNYKNHGPDMGYYL